MEELQKTGYQLRRGIAPGVVISQSQAVNAERIELRKMAAGVTEETNTWSGWKKLGYEVIHGSKALFGCSLIWGSKGDGAIYNARFFGRSQVQEAV